MIYRSVVSFNETIGNNDIVERYHAPIHIYSFQVSFGIKITSLLRLIL